MSKQNLRVALLLLSLLFLSCSRQDSPVSPQHSAVPPGFLAKVGEGRSSLDLIEDDYANGLLDKNNANIYREYAVSAPDRLPPKYRTDEKGKDATYSMLRMALEWNDLSKSTQQEILDLRANGFGNLKETVETPHFILHYTRQSNFSVPTQDLNGNGIPDFIDVAAQSWEDIWNREVVQLGYPAPKGTPQQKFHVYFKDMAYYGYTVPENVELLSLTPVPYGTASAWIAVENDFYGFPPNDEDVTGMETIRSGALKVTQAHEFMHACQFNINVYQSGWLFESTATWAEDAVYDHINDWHWYINRFLRNPDYPIFNRYVYGSAFFIHYLSERYGDDISRQIWFAAKTKTTPDAVRDAALGGTWEAIKSFAPAEYLLALSDFTSDPPSIIPNPKNTIRAIHDSYPVNVQVPSSTNKVPNRAPWGLGANFVDFKATSSGTVTIGFDGTEGYAWRAFVVASPKAGGPASTIEITLDSHSAGAVTITGFGTRWGKVTLVPTIADRPGAEVPYAYSASIH
ncbi:MAG: MXAN_6640 family putative metalloprotease [Bacteroidota bacterium]